MVRKTARAKKYFAPQNEGREHKCDHPGCTEKGEYRAPKDRRLKEYYWFCLKHVQEYNQKWNYYDGISAEAPEDENKFSRMHFRNFSSKIKYSFGGGFDEYKIWEEYVNDYNEIDAVFNTAEDLRNLKIMELSDIDEDITLEVIKKQYKKLVKKYHPDLNQGDKAAEEKFKMLSVAYKELVAKLKN